MNYGRHIPLSILVLLIGVMVALVGASFAINLAPSPYTGSVVATIAILVFLAATGFIFWIVRELEHSEEWLRVVVESAHDGIITTDGYGFIERINTSTVSMFGYRPGKLVGEHVSALLSSAHGERGDSEDFVAYLEREGMGELGVPHEVSGLRLDGQRFHMDMSIAHARLGEEDMFIIMVRDVTERVGAQRVLQEARDQLEHRVRERTAALEESNSQLASEVSQRKTLIEQLQQALTELKTLNGLLPICASCKKIRDDKGYWNQIEVYIRDHSDAEFSHGICPGCIEELYPELSRPLNET